MLQRKEGNFARNNDSSSEHPDKSDSRRRWTKKLPTCSGSWRKRGLSRLGNSRIIENTAWGGVKMLCLCHRIIDLSNQLCTKSDDKAIFVQR